jgi:hypothetical protein
MDDPSRPEPDDVPPASDPVPDPDGAGQLVAAFADYNPALLRRALLGEAGSGSAGRDLLADTIECAEDESGG